MLPFQPNLPKVELIHVTALPRESSQDWPEKVEKVGNPMLTIPEKMFLCFIDKVFNLAVNEESDSGSICTNEQVQSDFYEWVAETFKKRQFASEELQLKTILPSIREKTQIFVMNTLRKKREIDYERMVQDVVNEHARSLADSESVKSKNLLVCLFTTRQFTVLINTARELRENNFIGAVNKF